MKRDNCRLCKSKDMTKFLELGPQPLAGKFLKPEQLKDKEEFFPLGVYFCNECKLAQILDVVPKDVLFSEYFYAPHSLLSGHFSGYAKELANEFGLDKKQPFPFSWKDIVKPKVLRCLAKPFRVLQGKGKAWGKGKRTANAEKQYTFDYYKKNARTVFCLRFFALARFLLRKALSPTINDSRGFRRWLSQRGFVFCFCA